jgi:anti-sigma factor RsiW
MACTWIERDEVFEGYVRGTLGPEERHAFEEHFFGCEACFDKVETYRALHAELRAAAADVPVTLPVFSRTWRWVSIAAAAGLVAMVGLTMWLGKTEAPSPETTLTTAPGPQAPGVTPLPPAPAATVPAPAPPAGRPRHPRLQPPFRSRCSHASTRRSTCRCRCEASG